MFSLLGLDKVIVQIIGGIGIVAVLFGGYYYWKHSVKAEALAEFNKAQLEQVQKEQKELIKDLNEVVTTQRNLIQEMNRQKELLDKKFEDLESHLDSPETLKKYKDKPASDVLKRTFKELNK